MWLVRGHYHGDALLSPTSDAVMFRGIEITVAVCETEADADSMLTWYPDGFKWQVVEHYAEDSGGSSYLCGCSGDDTGRHADWCHYLNLFVPVSNDLRAICRQLLNAEYGSNAWVKSWDDFVAVIESEVISA